MRYQRLLDWARRGEHAAEDAPDRWLAVVAAGALFLFLLTNAPRIVRMVRAGRLRKYPNRAPDQAAALWYGKMAGVLAKRGLKKATTQTAQEFVQIIEDPRLRTPVARFTQAYESARFGNSPDDARRLPELFEEVHSVTKK